MTRQPAMFISHGAPTWALEPGQAGALLRALGERLQKPDAVVIVSPHWMTRGFAVTTVARPETIHDFGGFPAALYELQYPAPGSAAMAQRVAALLQQAGVTVTLDPKRGLDHGAWVPLMHLFPQADVPVIQVSIPVTLDARNAWQLGEALAPLRDENVLVIGSGSLTHNLHEIFANGGDVPDAGYALEFVDWARRAVHAHDRDALIDYLRVAPHARRAHPTSDHYLPLLVAAGAAGREESVDVLDGGITYGVLSMDTFVFGAAADVKAARQASP